jgi:hypothetical protein
MQEMSNIPSNCVVVCALLCPVLFFKAMMSRRQEGDSHDQVYLGSTEYVFDNQL